MSKIMIPLTEETDPYTFLLEPNVLLTCPGSGKRHGKRCPQSLAVPLCAFGDTADLHAHVEGAGWVLFYWLAEAGGDENVTDDDGVTCKVRDLDADDRLYGVIQAACVNHAAKWVREYRAAEVEEATADALDADADLDSGILAPASWLGGSA